MSGCGLVTFCPRTRTSPVDGPRRPAKRRRGVVLPQPEGPTTHRNAGSRNVNVTSARTWRSPVVVAKLRDTARASSGGVPALAFRATSIACTTDLGCLGHLYQLLR